MSKNDISITLLGSRCSNFFIFQEEGMPIWGREDEDCACFRIEDCVQHLSAFSVTHWMPISREVREGSGRIRAFPFLEKLRNLRMVPCSHLYWHLLGKWTLLQHLERCPDFENSSAHTAGLEIIPLLDQTYIIMSGWSQFSSYSHQAWSDVFFYIHVKLSTLHLLHKLCLSMNYNYNHRFFCCQTLPCFGRTLSSIRL